MNEFEVKEYALARRIDAKNVMVTAFEMSTHEFSACWAGVVASLYRFELVDSHFFRWNEVDREIARRLTFE